jgi:hypothetical protein
MQLSAAMKEEVIKSNHAVKKDTWVSRRMLGGNLPFVVGGCDALRISSDLYIIFQELQVHYFGLISMPCIAVAHTSSSS